MAGVEEVGAGRFAMRPLSLVFADADMERRFREDWAQASIPQQRLAYLVGIIIYTTFGAVDLLMVPEAVVPCWTIRAVVVAAGCVALALLLPRPAAILGRMQAIGFGVATAAGVGVVAMTLFASGAGAATYYAGVLAVIVFAGFFVRLRFPPAAASVLVMVAAYALSLPVNGAVTLQIAANNLAFVAAVAGMVLGGAWTLDRSGRTAFAGHVRLEEQAASLADALANVRELSGLIPVCAWCHKVRDDDGYWRRLEQYLGAHSRARVSHGMCPECFATHAGEAPA